MSKEHEDSNCPMCNERFVYGTERGPDPDQVAAGVETPAIVPLRKRWKCDTCGHEDENSAARPPFRT